MRSLKIKKIILISIFVYDFIVLLNFLLNALNNYPQKQSALFTFSIILFFAFILAIINPKSKIDDSPVISSTIHNFLITLIVSVFFVINMGIILSMFSNLISAII